MVFVGVSISLSISAYGIWNLLDVTNPSQDQSTIPRSETLMAAPVIPPSVPQDYTFNDSNQIQWKPNYHLKISDFTGKPNFTKNVVAWTTWNIIGIHFDDIHFIGSYPNLKYSVSNIRIHGFFVSDQSWYKQNMTICSNETAEQLLQHEQGHFDLAEVFARIAYSEASKEFNNKTFAGEGNSSSIQQTNAYYATWDKIKNIIDPLKKEMRGNDTVYESLTNNGCYWKSQQAYNDYFKNLRK